MPEHIQEALVDQLLENQQLYNLNSAMKHGVPEPPRRVRRTVRRKAGADAAAATTTQETPQPPPTMNGWGAWLQRNLGPLLFAGGLGAAALYGIQEVVDATTQPRETLLEFLEREGLTPAPTIVDERPDRPSQESTD